MNKFYNIILFLLCLGCAGLTYSQTKASENDSLVTGEILVEANRIRTSVLFSPNKVQVIDERFISRINGNKLSDALALADAVFIKDYGFNSGLKTISLNFTQSEHTLILLDGIKLNSEQHGQFDLGSIQLDDISKIEVSTGGASSLYGSDAIGGVINILSADNELNKPIGFNIKSEIGSYGYKKIFLKLENNLKLKNKKMLGLSISYANENAQNNYEYLFFNGFTSQKKERQNSDYLTQSANINFNYKPDDKSFLKFFTLYNYWNRNFPGIELGSSPDFSNQTDRNVLSSLSYRRTSHTIELNTRVDYKYSLMNYSDPETFTLQSIINSFYKLSTLVNSSELKFNTYNNSEIRTGYEASFSNNISNEVEASSLVQTGIYAAGKTEFSDLLFSKVTLFPSVRYDNYSNIHQGVLTGKMGLNIKPFKKINLTLKSSAGNNFRAPTFNDLFWMGLGNKDLLPEKSISLDGGVYYGFHLLADNQLEFSLFDINTTNRIIWTPDANGIWRPENIGQVRSKSIDISFRTNLSLLKHFSTNLSLNYNYGTSIKESYDYPGDDTYGKQLIYVPQEYFKSSLGLSYYFYKGLLKQVSANLFYTYTGKRYTDPENTRFEPYYDLIDANINVTFNLFNTDASFKFMLNNVTNTDYKVIAGYPMPLRNYKFQFAINY